MTRQMVFSRPRFFSGQLFTADDLAAEQAYHRAIQRFRNLHTHGYGIVSGLSVQTGDNGTSVTIRPGYAIDGFGREICVSAALKLSLPNNVNRLAVCVGYAETETEPITSVGNPMGVANPVEHSRIEEGFEIVFRQIQPGKPSQAQIIVHSQGTSNRWVLLAILRRNGKSWRADSLGTKSSARKSKRKRVGRK